MNREDWLKLRRELQGTVTAMAGGEFLVAFDQFTENLFVFDTRDAVLRHLFSREEVLDNIHKTDTLTLRLKLIKEAAKT